MAEAPFADFKLTPFQGSNEIFPGQDRPAPRPASPFTRNGYFSVHFEQGHYGMTFITAQIHRLRKALCRFRTADSGNFSIILAVSIVPVIGLVGAAVDYSRASSAKAAMQAVTDATGLLLVKDAATLTKEQLGAKATTYFNAQFNRPEVTGVTVTPDYTTTTGPQIVLTATGSVPTTIMGFMGFSKLDVGVSSTVKWGNTRLRLALVLDNSGSMNSANKMTSLKNATHSLITTLQNVAVKNGDVYISIIPFVKDVNADPANHSKDWVGGWTEWEREPVNLIAAKPSGWSSIGPGSNCPFRDETHGFRCTTGPVTGSAFTGTIPSSGTYKGYICPSVDAGNKNPRKLGIYYNGCYNSVATTTTSTNTVSSGSHASCSGYTNCTCTGNGGNKVCKQTVTTTGAPYAHTWIKNAHNTWTGCTTDRDQNYDTTNTPASADTPATLMPAEQYDNCPTPLMALSYDWAALHTKVNAMSPDGGTNQAIGLQWGFQSLTSAPFIIPPTDPKYKYQQAIILLTDGLNTQDRWYGNGSSHSTEVDARQKILCDNIKKAGITIYAVQVNTGSDPTSALLENCASPPTVASPLKKFFLLSSGTAITDTFNEIAKELSSLRLAK